jgi:hypothetical protein
MKTSMPKTRVLTAAVLFALFTLFWLPLRYWAALMALAAAAAWEWAGWRAFPRASRVRRDRAPCLPVEHTRCGYLVWVVR